MGFRVGYVPVIAISALLGIFYYKQAFTATLNAKLLLWKTACRYKAYPGRDVYCQMEGFFAQAVQNEIAQQLLTVFGSFMGVVCLYFFLQGGKGGRSIFLHPLVTIAWTLAGQLVGVGIVGPLVVPLLLVASKVAAPARDGLPPPPTKLYIYTIIGFQVLTTILAGAMANVPPTETVWPALHFAFQIFPLYYLPLAFLPLSSNKKHVETEPSTLTATVFKVLFYLQLPTWYMALGTGLNAYGNKSVAVDAVTAALIWDFVGCLTLFASVLAIDFISGDARGTISPSALFAYFVLAGPPSAAAKYFEAQERKDIKRAALKQEKKL